MSASDLLIQERRKRLAAERQLEQKQAELFAANRKLGLHAQELTNEIVETRAVVAEIRGENLKVKSDLNAANDRVALIERRLWHSIQTINDGFALFDADDEMIMANQAYLAVFDGMSLIKPGVNYTTILQILTEEGIVNTGTLTQAQWRAEMTHRMQQENPNPLVVELWNGRHIRMIDQRGPGGDWVSLGHDITEAVIYERNLEEARSNAESANRAKSAFLANMSHEIRTPMNGVVGMADVLKDTELSEDQSLYVETIKSSGEALLVILNDVLDYSKIEANKLDLKLEMIDLQAMIDETVVLLSPIAQQNGLTLEHEMDRTGARLVECDAGRMRQVLTNLIGNALKFTTQGGVKVKTTMMPSETAGHVITTISVQDTGIGIPPQMLDHIFQEFNQVENERNRQFDGTGLGLSISQRLVSMMGGHITVTSQEGVGSCFTVTLDLPSQNAVQECTTAPRRLRVLAAEDNKTNQLVFRKMIGALNVDLTLAMNGQEAVESYTQEAPDLIFMDISMPVMDGKEATGAIRALEATSGKHTPIIAMTAHAMEGDETAIYAAGIDTYLTKPLQKSQIIGEIEKVWNDRFEALHETPLDQAEG